MRSFDPFAVAGTYDLLSGQKINGKKKEHVSVSPSSASSEVSSHKGSPTKGALKEGTQARESSGDGSTSGLSPRGTTTRESSQEDLSIATLSAEIEQLQEKIKRLTRNVAHHRQAVHALPIVGEKS